MNQELREEITNLKTALFKERLLAAATEIINNENLVDYIGIEEYKKIRKSRNMAAHYLYQDKEVKLSENDLHERYSLFIDAYKKHPELLVFNRDLETNKKLVSLIIGKISDIIDTGKINTNSDNYLDTKEYWQLA